MKLTGGDMKTLAKENGKGLHVESLDQLQFFFERVKSGAIIPFKEGTEKARKNLQKAGLIG